VVGGGGGGGEVGEATFDLAIGRAKLVPGGSFDRTRDSVVL
jgi:hypothetical protein